jgi:hypothetical protein
MKEQRIVSPTVKKDFGIVKRNCKDQRQFLS